MMYLGE